MNSNRLPVCFALAVVAGTAIVTAQRQPPPSTARPPLSSRTGRGTEPVQGSIPANSVERLLQQAFTKKNPKVTRTKVLELRSVGMGAGPYILLGWGIRADMMFSGNFEDELFGVFVLDNNLSHIDRTLEIFPTCGWNDCIVSLEQVSAERVTVIGEGSYGDGPFRKVYWLHHME